MPPHTAATFRAHNVDYDTSDSEVDDTKELQIEEALKLYQSALKFHSEGPTSYYEAQEAYRELFESEIFTYPESLTEYQRWLTLPHYDELLQQTFDPVAQTALVAGDNAPNTLPQVLHLALKNRAQFMLDVIAHRITEALAEDKNDERAKTKNLVEATESLQLYASALDKDEGDLDIWRRSANVSMWAGSYRMARFCLEAVLDGDQDGLESLYDMPGIDEMLASEQLQHLIGELEDDVSHLIGPMRRSTKRQLSATMKKLINPYPIMKPKTFDGSMVSKHSNQGRSPERVSITLDKRDWQAIGEHILQHSMRMQDDGFMAPGMSLKFELPNVDNNAMQEDVVIASKEATKKPLPTHTVASATHGMSAVLSASENAIESDGAPLRTVQTQSDVKTEDAPSSEKVPVKETSDKDSETAPQNQRKRSTESAGLPENAEGGRMRSKRIRARWTTGGERIDVAQAEASKEPVVDEYQLGQLKAADLLAHETLNPVLERLVVKSLIPPTLIDKLVSDDGFELPDDYARFSIAIKDLFATLKACEPHSLEPLYADSFAEQSTGVASRQSGLNVFLGQDVSTSMDEVIKSRPRSDTGLDMWVKDVNAKWLPLYEIAWKWLVALLKPMTLGSRERWQSSYMQSSWSEEMKQLVRQLALAVDAFSYKAIEDTLSQIEARYLEARSSGQQFNPTSDDLASVQLVEALFEVLVDGFARTKAETLTSNQHLRKQGQTRLAAWSQLALRAIKLSPTEAADGTMENLQIRHVWAQATYISLHDDTTQEYNLACVRDLHEMMRNLDGRVIVLPNNDAIKEISLTSVEAKLRRLNMKDLFLRVFGNDKDDDDSAINIIHTVEPLLDLADRKLVSGEAVSDNALILTPAGERHDAISYEIANFVANSNISLRIALWRRLRDAYQALLIKPMITYCDLRTIDLLIEEMQSDRYSHGLPTARIINLLQWLRLADDLILRVLTTKAETAEFLSSIDAQQVKKSMASLASLLSILHTFRLVDDQVTVGQCQTPGPSNRSHAAFTNLSTRMNDFTMRTWTLLYLLLKDATEQFPEAFANPFEDRLNFLRAVHHAVGPRGVCNAAKKAFLKLERDELLELSDHPDANWETCQVLFDLNGLKSTQLIIDLADHGCDDPETLTRKEALKLLGFMIAQADKIPLKDLLKAELKSALDTVQEAIGKPRASESSVTNKRALSSYIRGPVNPLNLYGSLKGSLTLSTKKISPTDMPIASKGWYMLMGKVSLAKFRSVKPVAGMDVEDLDAAMNFFLLDLEYNSDQWETWYRLGQVYDMQVEQAIAWNAEKLTSSPTEVLTLQRQAINCYAMAVSCVIRNDIEERQPSFANVVGELFADFGVRVYSSSRDPFCMKAFTVKESEEKIYNRVDAPGSSKMYKAPSFVILKVFSAWRLSASLLREAIRRCPDKWLYHYTLGKCLWKMYTAPDNVSLKSRKPQMEEVINAFTSAVAACPKTKGSKEEPVLEPHYKIVSIAHKLVNRGLDYRKGAEFVQVSKYASKIPVPSDSEDWEEYVLKILKTLRSADKASWHHRMTVRAAQIVYLGSDKDMFGAMTAHRELTQQMFTKTMTLQVWRPACERPGRHFVYKTRYVRFFVELLERTKDRSNFELLVRRLRKKVSEYWEHKELWQDVCLVYLKMLRAATGIPANYDEIVFKGIMHDEFLLKADALEKWARTAQNNNILDVLREAAELKKLNGTYMKSIVVDELMTDSYAQLYAHVAGDLEVAAVPEKEEVKTETAAIEGETAANDDKTNEPAIKGRVKGVGRRELLKRAELAGSAHHASSSAPTPSERRSAAARDKDKESQSSEVASLRRSVSVVVPASTPRRLESIAVDLDTGSDSELSEMSNEEIDEIGDALPSDIKHALGVGRRYNVAEDEVNDDGLIEGHAGLEAHQDEHDVDDADDEGDMDEDDQALDNQETYEHDDQPPVVEESILDDDDIGDAEENLEVADDADDEGHDGQSAMDLDESALVEEQMRMESGA